MTRTRLTLAGMSQGVAHEVHAAALPSRVQDPGDGSLDVFVRGIGTMPVRTPDVRGTFLGAGKYLKCGRVFKTLPGLAHCQVKALGASRRPANIELVYRPCRIQNHSPIYPPIFG